MREKIIKVIRKLKGLLILSPATEEQVWYAEKKLGLKFAPDYKQYVMQYGAISAGGMELTGVTDDENLDVVAVTLRERRLSDIPNDMYVIEDMGIEGLLALQNEAGEVYTIMHHAPLEKLCGSLAEYIRWAQS